MDVLIRPATQQDALDAVRVVKAVYDEYDFTWDAEEYHADLYDLQGHYLDPGNSFFVAEIERNVVGTAALDLYPAMPGEPGSLVEVGGRVRIGGTDCSMERLYVHPDARRLGIGRRLVEALIHSGKQSGCRAMEIWSDKRFTQAHCLYQSFGATVVGDRICHDPDQSPEWGLILPL